MAWQHQAITWTNVDLILVKSSDIRLRKISLKEPQLSITKISLKVTYLNFIEIPNVLLS